MTTSISFDLIQHELSSPIVRALLECDDELRSEAVALLKQLNSNELDDYDFQATLALIAEILFPNADHIGIPGLDLEEAEGIARKESPESNAILNRMDTDESAFAERLRSLMTKKQITQEQLANKIGVGQSAISMMLNRNCRPQKRTVVRIAEALNVAADELWPNIKIG